FDHSISYAEKRTHQPYASNSYNNNDEIRTPIEHQDLYTLPWFNSLYIEGNVTVFYKDNKKIESTDVRFANAGVLSLFEEIRYEIVGNVIDRVRNPGIVTAMKGYATYNNNQSVALQN